VDVISAVVDNIPVMFAILIMNPVMDQIQWLLVTGYWLLVTGYFNSRRWGNNLLSIGSTVVVALMA